MVDELVRAAPTGGRSDDPAELAKFSALAESWWDPVGAFRALHQINTTRLSFIKGEICRHFERDVEDMAPFGGLRVLDVGCGGGLLCEPMARLGADVTGLDAAGRNIEIATAHSVESGLDIDYQVGTAEKLAETGARFDVVLNMEVVEHVADVPLFLAACSALVRPQGLMFLSTINRTKRAFLLAIVGAEYVLRWVPRGTHNWRRFVRPAELRRGLSQGGVDLTRLTGMVYDPVKDNWRLKANDLAVNYLGVGVKRPV
ncbi:MAG: bifunctional 2-polyprenyl-6-hydroxyphenol methylase/3-demethylubiquinol 3-O-methyltransferase UbiG [Alphaproteobacteria bacterium]